MDKIRKWSLGIIWLTTPLYLSISVIPCFLLNLSHGWPEIPIKDLDQSVFFANLAISSGLSNLPDLISMAVYFKMWCDLKSQVHPGPDDDNHVHDIESIDEPYGGIWVGGEPGINPSDSPAVEMQDLGDGDSMGDLSGADIPVPQDNAGKNDTVNKVKSVMQVLWTHVAVALLDLSIVFFSVLMCSKYGAVLAYLASFLFGFWIPLLVILRNFKQFNSFWSYLSHDLFRA